VGSLCFVWYGIFHQSLVLDANCVQVTNLDKGNTEHFEFVDLVLTMDAEKKKGKRDEGR
jgi:lantibiotic modifying enzyme